MYPDFFIYVGGTRLPKTKRSKPAEKTVAHMLSLDLFSVFKSDCSYFWTKELDVLQKEASNVEVHN